MPLYTIERTYRLPIYQHRTYHDESVEGACREALDDDDWSDEKRDYETAGKTYISGIWSGKNTSYKGNAIPIPANFADSMQRKAEHFDALMAVLAYVARPMGLSRADFEQWLPRARAALAKGDAIRADMPDP